jgi:hypothetical protein
MSSRRMRLLPWAALRSDSEQEQQKLRSLGGGVGALEIGSPGGGDFIRRSYPQGLLANSNVKTKDSTI